MKRNPQRLLAYALIVIGVVMLVSRIGGADWLWLALISALFLFGYVTRQNYNFLVAGGVLMGIAVGTLIGTDSGMLLSLAAGFLAIDRVEPRANRWALYSAGIFAVLGALVALGSFGLLSSAVFALALVAFGAYLLYREGNKPDTPQTPTTYTPGQAADPTPAQATSVAPKQEPAATSSASTSTSPPEIKTPRASESPSETTPQSVRTPEPAAPASPIPVPPEPLSAEAEARLRRLEAWRRETAAEGGVPPYIVFSNDTLAKIAAANPRTLDELGTIKGVGPVKRSRYGETVLEVLSSPGTTPESPPN